MIRAARDPGAERSAAAAAAMSEAALQDCVLNRSLALGWLGVHFQTVRAVNTRGGTRAVTPFRGRRGFPDCALVHPTGAALVAELKSARGRVEPDQQTWLDAYARNPAVLAALWRPEDWYGGRIDRLLNDPERVLELAGIQAREASA